MKRSYWITRVTVLQALWAMALVGLVVFLLILARKARPEVSGGLKTGSAVLAVPALFAVASWYGLWKKTLWGWWLTLFTDSAYWPYSCYSMVAWILLPLFVLVTHRLLAVSVLVMMP